MPSNDSPNSRTWKDQAEALAAELLEVTQQRDELQERLDEIAAIAAPDEQEERQRTAQVLAHVEVLLQTMANPKTANEPGPVLAEP